jgi:ribokinase
MAKIVVVGSINTDMIIRSHQIPIPGQTVLGHSFLITGGGKGANQAVAAARLGGEVVLVGKIGQDSFGEQALAMLRQENIDTRYLTIDPVDPSGVAFITVDNQGENTIVVASGANANLLPADVLAAEEEISRADAVLFQLETPLETIRAGMQLAKKHRRLVILNPAPAQMLDDNLLRYIDIITPNQLEALFLTDLFVEDRANAVQAAEILHRKGTPVVIVTMSEQGAYISSQDFKGMIPTRQANVVDTTGAGDTFSGALAVALAEGKSVPEAVHFANFAATFSVTKIGSQASIPFRWELDAVL